VARHRPGNASHGFRDLDAPKNRLARRPRLRYRRLVKNVTSNNFGVLIAYLVPGATALWGLSSFSPSLRAWFAANPTDAPTISGFLYLTLASLAVGMTVTAIRWVFVDLVHAATGLKAPDLDFSQLPGKVDAFNLLIEIHYRHYLFYSNALVATAITWICHRISSQPPCQITWIDLGFVVLEAIFFRTSRDTLQKYHQRTLQLLVPIGHGDPGERPDVANQKAREQKDGSAKLTDEQ